MLPIIFGIIVVCAPLFGMENAPTHSGTVPSLCSQIAHLIHQEFSSPDAEGRYSEQEAFDLIGHLKAHAVWDLVARKIPRDSSGEEIHWIADNTVLAPRCVARRAPGALYHDPATGALQYQSGSMLRSLEGVCVKNPASWILSDCQRGEQCILLDQ